MLVFSCGDSTLVQPEDDLTIAAAARASRTVLNWQESFDHQEDAGDSFVTESGVLHMWGIHNVFEVAGDVNGYAHVYGRCTINLSNGKGTCSIKAVYDIAGSGLTGSGTFECAGDSKLEDFPVFVQHGYGNCKGTGDYAGLHMKYHTYNPIPGGTTYDTTAEIW